MTLKTSLFNKGIYKSALRRFLWGSLLYFIILFVTTALPIILVYDPSTVIGRGTPVLYEGGFIIISLFLAMVIPTVVGLLIFRFIHSKKTSIFVHSLPVNRTAVYISSVVAGLTLMMVPVILNGIILGIMSFSGYGTFLPVSSVICWTLVNLLALFTMFGCASFVSTLTGNSFAAVVLTILFHGIIPLTCAALGVFAETFLFGFTDISDLITKVAEGNLVVRLVGRADSLHTCYRNGIPLFGLGTLWEILAATVLYGFGWILYKNRNLENAEDVAGFKVLNPIFKYLVTFLAAICAFALFGTFVSEKTGVFAIILFIVSMVTYFASEMLLKKTLKVWKSYKGYIVFAATFAVMTCIFAFTGFFGFETRIPSHDQVESVALYNYYNYDEPYVEDGAVIVQTISEHEKLISKDRIYTVKPYDSKYHTRIHVKYKLKNGRELKRSYWITEGEKYDIMNRLYCLPEYRKAHEGLVNEKPEDVYRLNIYSMSGENVTLTDPEEINGLHAALTKDLMTLGYDKIYNNYNSTQISFEINREQERNPRDGYVAYYSEATKITYAEASINTNFKNTNRWLEENGYAEYSCYKGFYGTVYVAETAALEQAGYNYEFLTGPAKMLKEPDLAGQRCVYLSEKSKTGLEEYLRESYISYSPAEEKYQIFCSSKQGGYDHLGFFSENEMGKILEYIIE